MKIRLAICSYYSNGDRKEINIISARTYADLYRNSLKLSREILISIYRRRFPFKILALDRDYRKIYCGVSSFSQKYVYEFLHKGSIHFKKVPQVMSANAMLENEVLAINSFRSLGLNCMERVPELGKYVYKGVEGEQSYNVDLVINKYCTVINESTQSAPVPNDILTFFINSNIPRLDPSLEILCTISHGDLTSWNSFIHDGDIILIDLERYSPSRVQHYDIVYYLLSENILKRQSDLKSIIVELENLRYKLGVSSKDFQIICCWIFYEKSLEASDGQIYRERISYLKHLEQILEFYANEEFSLQKY